MAAYYNEHDRKAAATLRELIKRGLIAPGDVDERDIRDVRPNDIRPFTQVHLYAGSGTWSYAARLAGWPDDRPMWTFSEPCQPYSSAGKGLGDADERYLRWATHHLVTECRPETCFGEQVASDDGLTWLDTIQSDMEGEDYSFWPFDLCAAGFGAPHIRQRIYFVAKSEREGLERQSWNGDGSQESGRKLPQQDGSIAKEITISRVAISDNYQYQREIRGSAAETQNATPLNRKNIIITGKPIGAGSDISLSGPGSLPTNGHWRDADWLFCRDGKWRPVEPGTFPLAHGTAERVGRLRMYGNGIVAQQAAQFIKATM